MQPVVLFPSFDQEASTGLYSSDDGKRVFDVQTPLSCCERTIWSRNFGPKKKNWMRLEEFRNLTQHTLKGRGNSNRKKEATSTLGKHVYRDTKDAAMINGIPRCDIAGLSPRGESLHMMSYQWTSPKNRNSNLPPKRATNEPPFFCQSDFPAVHENETTSLLFNGESQLLPLSVVASPQSNSLLRPMALLRNKKRAFSRLLSSSSSSSSSSTWVATEDREDGIVNENDREEHVGLLRGLQESLEERQIAFDIDKCHSDDFSRDQTSLEVTWQPVEEKLDQENEPQLIATSARSIQPHCRKNHQGSPHPERCRKAKKRHRRSSRKVHFRPTLPTLVEEECMEEGLHQSVEVGHPFEPVAIKDSIVDGVEEMEI